MSEPPIVPDEDPGPVILGWNDAPVSGDRVDVHQGPLIAGDPGGARVEVTGDGLHAYDATGTETARIQGEGGEFVGGEFRTSDALPGQVTLSDTANQGTPGIAVEPGDSSGYDVLPSIGPGPDHMSISGGVSTGGEIAGAQFSANGTTIYHNSPGANGAGSWVQVNAGEARLAFRPDRLDAVHESGVWVRPSHALLFSENATGDGWISASPTSARLEQRGPGDGIARTESRVFAAPDRVMIERKLGGADERHRLVLDDDGVWVQNVSGITPVTYNASYNLLETAQDSGWQSITPDAGYAGSASFAWRNKGGVIWYRGTVTATWTEGWNTIATLPAEVRPEYAYTVNEAGTSAGVLIRVQVDGRLELYAPAAGTSTHRFTSLSYPIG